MNPTSLTNTSQMLQGAGTGVGLARDIFGGLSSRNMYQYQGGIARMNADIAAQNADYALHTGHAEAARYGLGARQRMGKIVAAQAASNIDVGRGSARDVQEGQAYVTRMDIDQIHANAARKAYGYRVEEANQRAKAEAYDTAADNSLLAMGLNMGSTLLSGSTSVASRWLQARQAGIYGSDEALYGLS